MSDYQVNLPKTSFPMRADLAKREPAILKFWQEINLVEKCSQLTGATNKFILHDGPPYANGDIHLGHAANKIFKDIVSKAKVLSGYKTLYVPGWDGHGLPIEINVEKKIGKAGQKVTASEFITACRKYASEQIVKQKQDFMRLGVMGDWQHSYCTNDFKFEANIIRALAQVIKNGYLSRGYKSVHWCIACGSALAEAEVEYQNKTSPAIDVAFKFIDPTALHARAKNIILPIWTTTPWTLPANEAVAVHPEFTYVLVDCEADLHATLLIARPLLETTLARYGVKNYQVLNEFLGKDFAGQLLQHPFLTEKQVPVILGEHVTMDTGTGAVHTAPAHGADDYKIGVRYGLPIVNPVGPNGKFLSDTPYFADIEVFAANELVIQLLKERGNLLHVATIEHSYPHCWRHKTPLIFRATQQWFISMDKIGNTGKSLRQAALAEIEKIKWVPASGKQRMHAMVVDRPDWCISRQRVFGTPIVLFTHKQTGELHPETNKLMEIIAQEIEREGIDYWFKLDATEFLAAQVKDFAATDYEKSTDTLDVWFESGVTHFAVLCQRPELGFPADIYLEGCDQYRGWFQSSLLTALAIHGRSPYKQCVEHGFTVDAEGRKMSKSLGNVILPQKIISVYGADILRLWAASTYMHDDLAASDEIFKRNVDVYRMLRNTARFLLGNLAGFEAQSDLVAPEEMLVLDRYAVLETLKLQDNFLDNYEKLQFHLSCGELQTFISVFLSSFYFSIIKDRLYTMPVKSLGRRSAQTVLWHILEILVRLIAPILSFTAEEIWQEMRNFNVPRSESVFLARWYTTIKEQDFAEVVGSLSKEEWLVILAVRDEAYKELEKLRVAGTIGSSLEAAIIIYANPEILEILAKLKDELRFVFITSNAEVRPITACSKVAIATAIPELSVEVSPITAKKCMRCWHYRADVGQNAAFPELCGRCVNNISGDGETREFA
ncbi:MAG: isoleucine--tRNA ligase [Gammaproteobacteria bacterium]|nr:isoleucine--tRNA ligase [Gammaproteobacteria bacterium]